jgi:hypothetical protein
MSRPPCYSCSRRSLLKWLLHAIAIGGLHGCGAAFNAGPRERAGLPAWFKQAIAQPGAAQRFGRAYLQAHPDEATVSYLIDAIETAMTAYPLAESVIENHAFHRLDQTVRTEFRQGTVVVVERWVLSRTEARLYALAATVADEANAPKLR